MASHIKEAGTLLEDWLRGEHSYQFAKFDRMYGQDLVERTTYIMETEVPDKWFRGALFWEEGIVDQATQQIMKVCAAARAVCVYSELLEGTLGRQAASDCTFEVLANTLEEINEPADLGVNREQLRSKSFEVAFNNNSYKFENHIRESVPVFRRAAGLAVAHLCEVQEVMDQMIIPAPGVTSGQIIPWDRNQ